MINPSQLVTALQSVQESRESHVPDKSSLKELLAANEDLFEVYMLKDMLKQLWAYTYKESASKILNKWIGLAEATGIGELKRSAKGLGRARGGGLLLYCYHRITSAKVEAFNGASIRISVKACGYNDLEYF